MAPLTAKLLSRLLSTVAVDTIMLTRASCPSCMDKMKRLSLRLTNVELRAINSYAWLCLESMARRDGGQMQRPYQRNFVRRLKEAEPTATV